MALFAERFELEPSSRPRDGYNIAPGGPVTVIVGESDGAARAEQFHWGLIPAWAKSAETRYKMINARIETVDEKPAYRGLLEGHRCLIPADGFFEWQPQPEGPKQPWWFQLADAELFSFAGLWTTWQPAPDVEPVHSCTMLTCEANDVVSPVHHRMPVVLKRASETRWLDPAVGAAAALTLAADCANDQLTARPVSRAVNSTRNTGPECIAAPSDDATGGPATALF